MTTVLNAEERSVSLMRIGLALATGLLACSGAGGPATYDDVMNVYAGYRGRLAGVAEITVDEVLALDPERILFVDVREGDERAVSRIPGSITDAELESSLRARGASGDPPLVVAYCTVGYRSGRYVRGLAERGIDAANLSGSVLAWIHRGQPVVDSLGVTSRVHVYGRRWNLVPDGYEAVW